MIDNGKNKGEFDEDAFDDDFSDADFEETSFDEAEYADLSEDEAGYEGDDFEAEDWGDAEEEQPAGKKAKPKKEKSGGGLGFNAIVIIGAVVLGGGVLVFNVMRETNKAETAQPSMFQSILNIGGVMDGTLFGKEDDVATEQDAENKGFLNDPGTPIPTPEQNAENTPPQPAPIAPADGAVAQNEPLTPMPTPSAEAPRGPDDLPPTENTLATDETPSAASAVPQAPVDTATAPAAASAEDILKQAMANREQKQAEAEPSVEEAAPSPTDKEALEADLEKKMAEAKQKAEQAVENIKENVTEAVAPAPVVPEPAAAVAPVEQAAEQSAAPSVAEIPVETKQEISANKEAVSALEGKLDTLLSRMDKIENDLNSVRESNGGNTEDLEKTVASLKNELEEIKSRPAAAVGSSDSSDEAPAPKPVKKKRAPKPAAPEDEAYSPNKSVASTPAPKPVPKAATTNGRWELRAAQPGRAWVSKTGERDMQAVAVGDTLPGIGRIASITYMNGRWTVTGTQGVIQQ